MKELLEEIIEETGYMRELRAEATDEALSRLENIDEFDFQGGRLRGEHGKSDLKRFPGRCGPGGRH